MIRSIPLGLWAPLYPLKYGLPDPSRRRTEEVTFVLRRLLSRPGSGSEGGRREERNVGQPVINYFLSPAASSLILHWDS